MSTSRRHNKIINGLVARIYNSGNGKDFDVLTSDCALAHWGFKNRTHQRYSLVDVAAIDDVDEFIKDTINDLEYVQPDFLFFKDNPFLCNERETVTAGCPDLIIEIWSGGNTKEEREFKFNLYTSSANVEHWYIEQKSNEVACYLGEKKLKPQSLTDILRTRAGIEFDLRYLAIGDK
jgi:hypothetical protein